MVHTLDNPAVDVHSHFWITTDEGKQRLWCDKFPRNLDTVYDTMRAAGIRVSALTNTQDHRFEMVRDKVRDTRTFYETDVVVDRRGIIIEGEDGVYVIYHGEEIPCREGDLTVMGLEWNVWSPGTAGKIEVDRALDIAWRNNSFVVLDRPTNSPNAVTKSDAVESNPHYEFIDSIGVHMEGQSATDARKYAGDVGLPIIKTSDSHFPREVGRGFFVSKGEHKFNNTSELLRRIKSGVSIGERENHGRSASFIEMFRTLGASVYDLDFRQPLGLVETTFEFMI